MSTPEPPAPTPSATPVSCVFCGKALTQNAFMPDDWFCNNVDCSAEWQDRSVPPASAPAATAGLIAPKPCVCGHQHEWGIVNGEPTVLPACRAESDSGLRCSCRKYAPAAPSGEEAETWTLDELRADVSAHFAQLASWARDQQMRHYASDVEADAALVDSQLTALAEMLAALRARVEELEGALGFYAESPNWSSPDRGFKLQYDPELSPVQKDCGERARAALAPRQTTGDEHG